MTEIPSPETVAQVRRSYVDGVPVSRILAESRITTRVLYDCTDGKHPDGSGRALEPIPRRQRSGPQRRGGRRAALIARIWRTADKQVQDIEARLEAAGLPLAERESGTRMLAVVARTLRELNTVDGKMKAGQEATNNDDDEPPPRNIDELRRELAKKLEGLIAREQSSGSRGPQ